MLFTFQPLRTMLASACFLIFLPASGEAQYRPEWQVGQSWQLQQQIAHSVAKMPPNAAQNQGTETIPWQVTVEAHDGETYFLSLRSETLREEVELEIDQATLAVRRSRLQFEARDEARTLEAVHLGEGTVPPFDQIAPIPYSLPRFPLGEHASEHYSREVVAGEHIFEIGIREQVEILDDPAMLEDRMLERLGEPFPVPAADRYYWIRIESAEETIEQIWAEGYPWFLYSQSSGSIVRLDS